MRIYRWSIISVIWITIQFVHEVYLKPVSVREPPLLVLTFDGFRWDYLSRTSTPNFDMVIERGVSVTDGLENVFTTSTITNTWTMVTGLYSETHGMVENHMFDSATNKSFIPAYDKKNNNDPRFYNVPGVEPIWETYRRQKQHARSGTSMWWGSHDIAKPKRPSYSVGYQDHSYHDAKRQVKTLITWLTQADPINLGLFLFVEPDITAHSHGPDSPQTAHTVSKIDKMIGKLFDRLERLGILAEMNIIITSDHGMGPTSSKRLIYVDDIVDPSWYKTIRSNPIMTIIPHPGYEDKVYDLLHKASLSKPFTVYKKADIPERLHYKHSTRVTPIIMLADMNWAFVRNKKKAKHWSLGGLHGYDNKYKEMRPFFMAMGPSFKTNFTMESFEIIDMYALMCELLQIEPNTNNGSLAKVSQLLKSNKGYNSYRHLPWKSHDDMGIFIWIYLAVFGFVLGAYYYSRTRNVKLSAMIKGLLPNLCSIRGSDRSTTACDAEPLVKEKLRK